MDTVTERQSRLYQFVKVAFNQEGLAVSLGLQGNFRSILSYRSALFMAALWRNEDFPISLREPYIYVVEEGLDFWICASMCELPFIL